MNTRYKSKCILIGIATLFFAVECSGATWSNLMKSPQAGGKVAVGRGFGDSWNKYAWSMKDFGGGMIVGTKNAYFDYGALQNPSEAVSACMDDPTVPAPAIYKDLGCLELYAAPTSANTRYAEIWRFDYAKNNWTKLFDGANPDGTSSTQGFRIMETHNNKLYVGSDLGAFITGVALHTGSVNHWNFPGTKILSSTDGKDFTYVDCAPSVGKKGPCNSASDLNNTYGIYPDLANATGAVNTSIRAMASFKGKLYVGTFNALGGELWSYDENPTVGAQPWVLVKKFAPTRPAVTELRVYKDKLYIGLGGSKSGSDYLWSYDGTSFKEDGSPNVIAVASQPTLVNDASSFGVLKLFVSSKNLLYIGHVDLSNGFTLQSYDGNSKASETGDNFKTITDNGFGNSNNAYAWSMKEVNGRIFVGTFNQDFFAAVPRGSSELWYTDDSFNTKYKMDLPSDWGPWNYGIRTMEVGGNNKMLFLGSASNIVAPDLFAPLNPGAEVWSIRTSVVAPIGKGGK